MSRLRQPYLMMYANNLKFFRCFTTIAFSADGESILAAGKSKNVCIYNVAEGILLKKFEITQNHSLDGLDVSRYTEHFIIFKQYKL